MKSRLQTFLIIKDRKIRRSRNKVKTQRSLRYVSLLSIIIILIFISIIPIVGGYYYTQLTQELPSVEWVSTYLDPENGLLLSPTILMDKSGETEIYRLQESGNTRHFVSLDPNQTEFISPYVVQLTVAIKQPDFWSSPGYNTNIFSTSSDRTISEHLVEKLLLSEEPPSMSKNLRMRLLAAQIIDRFGRAQVLEWFLNSSSYGHHTIGIDSAARLYLQKNANELNLAEAALLVSTALTPSLNPLDAPQAALENQENLIEQLHQDGYISDEDYKTALATEINLVSEIQEEDTITRAYSALVLDELYDLYGRERVELGGLQVTTSLDLSIQEALYCTLASQINKIIGLASEGESCEPARLLPSLFEESLSNIPLLGSGVIMDPSSGEVVALVGNLNGDEEISVQTLKQGGTILSPLIAVSAFARGFSPATQVWDIPENIPDELSDYRLPIDTYKGPIRFRTALTNNYLAGISKLFDQIGYDVVARGANSFGLTTLSNHDQIQEILFAGESTTIVEVANFYSIFSNLGVQYGKKNPTSGLLEPLTIRKVEAADGLPIDDFLTDSRVILSSQLAYLVHDILQDDYERRATLGYPNSLDIGRPSGAKYGSTFLNDEVWTAGYTPQYVSVIWFGQSGNEITALNPKVPGGVWYTMMQFLHQDLPVENWQKPTGISEAVVCNLSGLLPTRECPSTIIEIFLEGTQPAGYDTLFKSYEINRETGLLATVYTAPDMVDTRTFMIVPEEAIEWANYNGIDVPPKDYDLIQAPNPNEDVLITAPDNYSFVNGVLEIYGTVQSEDMTSYRIQVGQGLNPATWLQIGDDNSRRISNRKIVDWDTTSIEDGLYALRLMVIRENLQVETHTLQVSVDNTVPSGRIIYPIIEQVTPSSSQGTITLQAEAFDSVGIDQVEWWLDGQKVGSSLQSPYSYPISINPGKHSVYIIILDLAGNQTVSETLEFVVE